MEIFTLVAFTFAAVAIRFLFNLGLSERYKHWYRPWLLLVLLLVASVFVSKAITLIRSIIGWDPLFLEIIYACFIALTWLLIKFILKVSHADEAFIKLLKNINSDRYEEKSKGSSNYLLWPYYMLPPEQVLLKAGTRFFKLLFLAMAIIVILLYFISVLFQNYLPVFIPTGMALLSSLIFIEWVIYLSTDKEIREGTEDIIEEEEKTVVDYEKLWNRYRASFPNGFSSAFIKLNDQKFEENLKSNDQIIKDLTLKFTESGCDIIASDLNLSNSFHKFSRILFESLNKGGNILILAEIPAHFKVLPGELSHAEGNSSQEKDLVEVFAEYLSQVIQQQVPASSEILRFYYYNADRVPDAEKRRILLTSVNNMLSEYLLGSEWIKNLELLVVINFHDSCLSSISEDRQFSILLNSIQSDYKTLLFTPFRNEIHAGLEHTWMLDKIEERRFNDENQALKSFYIGFYFEKWRENWNNIALPLTGNPIVSGLELTALPLSEKVKHVHLFETAYTEFREGKEDLAVHSTRINHDITNITKDHILNNIFINLLPIAITNSGGCSPYDQQHFSLIFDTENNSPKIYRKYAFLGTRENFLVILSKPHIFRDYFSSNILFLLKNPVEAIQPQLSKSKINLSLQLIALLKNNPVDKTTIINLFNQFGVSNYSSVHEEISDLFLEYFNYNIRDNFVLRYFCQDVFVEGKYGTSETYSINDQVLNNQSEFNFLKTVKIIDNADNILFKISLNLLFQNYLPGQIIPLNGRPYLFENYTSAGPTLQVRKTETKNILFYKSVFKVTLDGKFEPTNDTLTMSFFRQGQEYKLLHSILEIETTIETRHYFEFISAYNSPFASQKQPNRYALSENDEKMVKRSYKKGRLLKLTWDLLPDFKNRQDSITTMLHLLLYESMKIFYPYHFQYITLCSSNTFNPDLREKLPWIYPGFNLQSGDKDSQEGFITLYIIEDSYADLGVLKSLQRNFIYIMKHIFDLLLWYGEEPQGRNAEVLQYFENIPDKRAFIQYGLDENVIVDSQLMVQFIEHHLPIDKEILYEISTKRKLSSSGSNVECDFCRLPFSIDEVVVLEDGLHRCKGCSKDAIDTMESANQVMEESIKLFREHLDMDIKKYHYDFILITASDLHKLNGHEFNPTSMYDPRKLVGQAWDLDPDKLYIEKGYSGEISLTIMIHELCHIWEYNELNCIRIKNNPETACIMEGLSVWTEIFLMRKGGYSEIADSQESMFQNDETEYGKGFRYIKAHYGESPHQEVKNEFPI
ncbi:MAG: hypothetical protein NTW16_00375 [Bacteroidetes bacterium]|nr:hypothetical protein [Bacteroidota bacterium]